jgi:hypothetical protein
MKKIALIATFAFALWPPMPAISATNHETMSKMEHMEHMGGVAHAEVVNGVKATFKVTSMADHLRSVGMAVPKGLKETHHIAVEFKDARSGKALTQGEVKVKVQGPDKTEQTKDLMGMAGHFGADFDLSRKGRYGVMCKFNLEDGKGRQARFWYEVK